MLAGANRAASDRGEPAPADRAAAEPDYTPVAQERPRRFGARAGDAGLGDDAAAAALRNHEKGQRRLRVAGRGEGDELLARAHRHRLVAGRAPEAADGSGGELDTRALSQQDEADLEELLEHRRRARRPEAGAPREQPRQPTQ